jgi:hypothetical protein
MALSLKLNADTDVTRLAYEDALFLKAQEEKSRLLEQVLQTETHYDSIFAFVILLNLAVLGLDAQFKCEDYSWKMTLGRCPWTVMEPVFIVLYIIEFFARLNLLRREQKRLAPHLQAEDTTPFEVIYHRPVKKRLLGVLTSIYNRGWLIFDFVIIVVSVLDVYVISFMTTVSTENDASIITSLRFLRVARVLRSIKLFRYFKELYLLINGFFKAFRTLFWIVFLIVLAIYVCSIFFTRMIGHNREEYMLKGDPEKYGECDVLGSDYDPYDHWGTVLHSMYTLFQIVTLEGWSEIAEPIIMVTNGFRWVFVVFILFTHFTILNLFVAVIVEHVQSSSSTADLSLMREVTNRRQNVFVKLTQLFERADADNSGTLTCDELKAICDQPDVIETMRSLEVNASEIDWLFDVLDTDGNRILSIDEFVSGMLNVKSSEQSRQLFQVQHSLLKEIRHIRRVKHEIIGQEGTTPDSATQEMSGKVTPRSANGPPEDGNMNVQDVGPLGSDDGGGNMRRQKTGRGVPSNLTNTAFERKIGTVANDLRHLSSSFSHIRTSLADAASSSAVNGWDERSMRKARLVLDKITEQAAAFQKSRDALAEAVSKARKKNPRPSPRNHSSADEGGSSPQIPLGSPPSMALQTGEREQV